MSQHIGAKSGQIAKTVLMPGDPLRAKYIADTYLEDVVQYSSIRNMFGYTGTYKGIPVSVQGSGMGMPSMGIYSWELFTEYDVDNVIRIGTCGSFHETIKCGDVILAQVASTDSNYQHAFKIPGTFAPNASFDLLHTSYNTGVEMGLPMKVGNVVTCDVYYEFGDWWKDWSKMGVLAVEMESAALYMNAAYNGKKALSILTASDDFITGEDMTIEQRQESLDDMIKLALETAIKL